MYQLVATATFGLEAVVRREIEALGFKVVKTEDGRVTYEGDEAGIARSNLWLRSADRVYIKMAEFKAETFEELFQGTKAIPWEEIIPADGKIIVVGTSVKSTLHSVPACQSIINKAVADKLLSCYGGAKLPETGAEYRIRFAFLKDNVIILLDTSGDGLHKRGYRVSNVDAPIKETLAAALIQLSFWRKDRLLVDPCSGSGTIGIEAALIGLNIAPGISRKFAAEEWEGFKDAWKAERKKAYSEIDTETGLKIVCGDIDPRAIKAAKENAEAAGVEDQIEFIEGDMKALSDEGLGLLGKRGASTEVEIRGTGVEEGIIITNPPYGERIGEEKEIASIYKALNKFIRENPTWSLFMVTSDKDAEEKVMGRPADRRRKLYNGRIETTYYQFHGERKERKNK